MLSKRGHSAQFVDQEWHLKLPLIVLVSPFLKNIKLKSAYNARITLSVKWYVLFKISRYISNMNAKSGLWSVKFVASQLRSSKRPWVSINRLTANYSSETLKMSEWYNQTTWCKWWEIQLTMIMKLCARNACKKE